VPESSTVETVPETAPDRPSDPVAEATTAISETAPDRPNDPAVEAAAAGRVIDAKPQRRVKTKQKKGGTKPRGPPKRHTEVVGAYSVPDFCRLHGGMSEAFFFKLTSEGHGPKLMKVGARTMISVEAAAAWRREREREAEIAAEQKAKQQKAAAAQQQEATA
jgi:hypothetical protein